MVSNYSDVHPLRTSPKLILVANSEIRSIDLQQVLENLGCQLGQPSENEFATSISVGFGPCCRVMARLGAITRSRLNAPLLVPETFVELL